MLANNNVAFCCLLLQEEKVLVQINTVLIERPNLTMSSVVCFFPGILDK